MKKIIGLFLLIFIMLCMSGCSGINKIVLQNMSDMRINYFAGQNENYYVEISSGYREKFFTYDGISTQKTECAVISLGFFDHCEYSSVAVVVSIDGKQKEYVLQKSPYENVFMEDMEHIIKNNSTVEIYLKNQTNKVQLKCDSINWSIDYKKAIKIASNYLKNQINNLFFNNKLHAECYLKVASNQQFNNKYWYFSIITQNNKNYSVLIDVNSGKIVSNN